MTDSTDIVPSDQALWDRANALVRAAGPAFARQSVRGGTVAPVGLAVLAGGRLGTKAPEQAILAALRERPGLMAPDDGSDAWKTDLNTFLARCRDEIQRAGAEVLTGLQGAPVSRSSSLAAAPSSDLTAALEAQDPRYKKLLRMIREQPDLALQSVRKHLSADTVRWQNALTFQAHQIESANPGAAQLMMLAGDVLRQNQLDAVFSEADLVRIARFSMGVWLDGTHRDHSILRLRVAIALGELLDDPYRRPTAETALAGLALSAPLPAPADVSEEAVAAIRARLEPGLADWSERELAHAFSMAPLERVVTHGLQRGDLVERLAPADWVSIERWNAGSDRTAFEEIYRRVEVSLVDSAPVPGAVADSAPRASAAPRP